ncbi:hypothetical protein DL93DRAFT_2053375 [Clavulina sp. PMI_390]|nr:hypothetical protein DL93DRAFT_2053375 [Clavulina sp. PMI_390]
MSDCAIPSNPDVSGVGIRVGIYITSFLVALVPNLDNPHYGFSKLRTALLQAAGLNGFALLITAVIQTAQHQLDLYHAVIIMHQLSFLGITTISAGDYRASGIRVAFYFITMWALGALFVAWWLYVWITAPTFGASNFSNPSCSNHSIKYVLMFVNVRPTAAWLRWLAVAAGSIVALVTLFVPVMVWAFIVEERQESADLEGAMGITGGGNKHITFANAALSEPGPSSGSVIWRVLFAIYGTVMLELTVRRNDVGPGEGAWGFGQIVAVIIAVGGLNEVLQFFLGEEWRFESPEDEELLGMC